MDARRRRGIKKTSLRQERQTAIEIGGRTQANSGAVRMGGGADVRGSGLRIECKFTEKETYTLKFKELEKLRKQAIKTLETPIFQFAFKFRNAMTKYVAIKHYGDRQPNTLWIEAESVTFKRDWLATRLNEGPLFVTLGATKAGEPNETKVFQILTWDDFTKRFQESEGR